MMFARAYLRASTIEQDANRAKEPLQRFAREHGLTIAGFYSENESGATLKRPELFRLLADCIPGDVLLVEQVDRLSRLNESDWAMLRNKIDWLEVRIIALDLPTSWSGVSENETTRAIMLAVNRMMLDVLAAVARKDYTDRLRRQNEGIAKAQAEGAYRGRPENVDRNKSIVAMLEKGITWAAIIDATGCSRSTLGKLSARRKAE
jgi:DNA invertase Pin-like site-specific DNA recombinase